ncbi:hypothetical protein BESB_033950 [Besnoitia besnoiti]|uniref:SRS domain-containing protein n=1 Tax=Besnoitia besnoiti TaxID=94643 RepID=A0A2A9MME7_BESBE|nr:hypothetical protein BESB_033950 [Besnoitia besnoiti]PFH36937.1 hypothetical protein BESB_033950 [Besnoitia besnoiti]
MDVHKRVAKAFRVTVAILVALGILGRCPCFAHNEGHPEAEGSQVVHDCDPEVSPQEQPKVVTLPPSVESLKFKCGKKQEAKLTPSEPNTFFLTKQCHSPPVSLNEVCGGATLSPSEGQKPTIYTLNVNSQGRTKRSLFFKCLAAASEDELAAVAQDPSLSEPIPSKQPQSCILQVDVETEDAPQPETEHGPNDTTTGDHSEQGGGSAEKPDSSAIQTCNPNDNDGSQIELTLPPQEPSVMFSCGKEHGGALQPEVLAQSFCVDAACDTQQALSVMSEGVKLHEDVVGQESIYTLTVGPKPTVDHDIFFLCTLPKTSEKPASLRDPGVTGNVKKCTVKITVQGAETSTAAIVLRAVDVLLIIGAGVASRI